MNNSPTIMKIYQGTTPGQFTPLSELLLVESQQPPSPAASSTTTLSDFNLTGSALSPDQQQELFTLLCDYTDLFALIMDL